MNLTGKNKKKATAANKCFAKIPAAPSRKGSGILKSPKGDFSYFRAFALLTMVY